MACPYFEKNMRIIKDAWAIAYDTRGDLSKDEEVYEDDGDDYETHMRYECRQSRFV